MGGTVNKPSFDINFRKPTNFSKKEGLCPQYFMQVTD